MHRFILSFLTLLLALGCLTLYSAYYYHSPGPLAEPKTVIFKKGRGFREIVDDLSEAGVIRYPLLFKAVAVTLGDARQFKAGEYEFSAAISPKLIMDMIAEGRVVVHRLVIPEGLTVAEILARLDNEKVLEGQVSAVLKEGDLLPETYHFVYGDSRGEIVSRMQEGMATTLAELWEKRKKDVPLATPQEALTLASIIEKETGVAAERGRVAAVFVNRLKKGMKLQSDPTVIYAVEKEKGPLTRPLVTSDLAADSPYNTYKYPGLPPGPIANPGRDALEAALNPPDTGEFYFVATGTGGHHFAATLKEHNKNVKEYRKLLKQQAKK